MEKQSTIKCPNCGTGINVQDILSVQVEKEIKNKYQAQWLAEQEKYKQKEQELQQQREEFEIKKRRENELFQERLEKQLREERRATEEKLRKQLSQEQEDYVAELNKELKAKSEQVRNLARLQAEMEKLQREKEEMREALEAENQRKLNEVLRLEKEKIKRAEEEKNEMRFREMQKQLEDQKKLTEEMKRKQEQGSMQLQGEVQELAIEEWLRDHFPLDTIDEIKKGARGADCLQIVNTRTFQNCGKIYYESKRTKDFQPGWLEKFKTDMRQQCADVGILVTEAMPAGMDRMGLKDGVWICCFEEFKSLCAIIREMVIKLHTALCSQENRGDKMHLLYDYLTGNSFRMQIEAIVEGFSAMKNELDREKRAMQRIWKEREKQIEKVIGTTIDMYGSIKGIAGTAVQSVSGLELAPAEEEHDAPRLDFDDQ